MDKVESPCISVCRVKNGICIGCFRSSKEIMEWYDADTPRKKQIVEDARTRKKTFEEM